jgi:hypothetical protein
MIIDGALQFTGVAGTVDTDEPTTGTQVSTNVIDWSVARDMGIGDNPALKLFVQVMTAFADGTSLQVNLQGAPDNGSGAPGAYTTMISGPVVVEANLIAGARLLEVDLPRPAPAQAMPRFLRLQYVNVGTHTAGAIYGTILLDRQDAPQYPAGQTVPN